MDKRGTPPPPNLQLCMFTLKPPQVLQNPPRGTFGEKFSTVGNWYFHLFKWGKITTWQEVQVISSEYDRSMKMDGAF